MGLNGSLGGIGGGTSGLGPSNSVGTINFTGLASGIDTNTIIQQLLQVDQIPITNLQNQQATLQAEIQAIQQYQSNLSAFATAAQALTVASAFNPINATSSDTTVATITAASGASAGTYNLTVTNLAQAEKISSAAQTDGTSALNLTGTFVVDGHGIQVTASDSLNTIAQKINALDVGVSAGVINGGSGSTYLTMTSSQTGVANKIQISDVQGSVANSLGLLTGSATVRQSSGGAALSYAFSSQTTNLATQLNLNSSGPLSFSINGVSVTVDPNTTTLQGLATAINTANTGATASIVTGTDSKGNTTYQLKLAGMTSSTDSGNLLQGIGILQQGYGNEVLKAQDAAYSLDGVNLTSSSNTITNVVQGTTIQLLKGTPSSPASTTITLAQNDTAITTSVQNFVTAYNNLQGYVAQNTQLDTKTYQTGPLFGDQTIQQIQNGLAASLFSAVPGLQPPYNNLSAIGMSLDQSGNLNFDSTKLQAALQADPQAVANLFMSTGSGSTATLGYVSSTSKSAPTNSGAYAVNITQAATEGVFTASTSQTQPLASSELLTFNGALFGNTNYTLLLQAGETQQQVVNQINSDSTLKNDVTASIQNGLLTITSNKYGTNGNFTVTSDTAASSSSSGIQGGAFTAGLDVAGTINGEAATGNGQFLTGNSGNATTDGLQISYTGTATGAVGSITFNKGVGSLLNDQISNYSDPNNGLVTDDINNLNSQINDMGKQIAQLQQEMGTTQTQLQAEFANMETAMSQLQAEQKQLALTIQSSFGTGSTTS